MIWASAQSKFLMLDSATAFDAIRPKYIFPFEDSVSIDDTITFRASYGLFDEIQITKELTTSAVFNVSDLLSTATVSEFIESTLIKFLVENPTLIDDYISIRVFSTSSDLVLVDDSLLARVLFLRSIQDNLLIDESIHLTCKS